MGDGMLRATFVAGDPKGGMDRLNHSSRPRLVDGLERQVRIRLGVISLHSIIPLSKLGPGQLAQVSELLRCHSDNRVAGGGLFLLRSGPSADLEKAIALDDGLN